MEQVCLPHYPMLPGFELGQILEGGSFIRALCRRWSIL
jgi:hypothetical protein